MDCGWTHHGILTGLTVSFRALAVAVALALDLALQL